MPASRKAVSKSLEVVWSQKKHRIRSRSTLPDLHQSAKFHRQPALPCSAALAGYLSNEAALRIQFRGSRPNPTVAPLIDKFPAAGVLPSPHSAQSNVQRSKIIADAKECKGLGVDASQLNLT